MADLSKWAVSRSYEKSVEMLKGTIDLHAHAGPHLLSSPRSADPIELAMAARQAGMAALVYMDVFQMSCGTAWMVSRAVPDFKVYGGIILNTVFGGMNPRAVKTAIHYGSGAKFVSFGAHSTVSQAHRESQLIDGKYVLHVDRFPKFVEEEVSRCISIPLDGKLSPALEEILGLIADNPHIYLITGHVSPAEAIKLVEYGRHFGIRNMLVSSNAVAGMSLDQMREAIALGALLEIEFGRFAHTGIIPKTHYYVEPEWKSTSRRNPEIFSGGIALVADQIRQIGAEHFIFSTDFGVYSLPTPVEGMREIIASLMDLEFSDEEIGLMTRINPARMLGLA
jgi:hypothetical protein